MFLREGVNSESTKRHRTLLYRRPTQGNWGGGLQGSLPSADFEGRYDGPVSLIRAGSLHGFTHDFMPSA